MIGTLVTPYITGMGNLIFAWVLAGNAPGLRTSYELSRQQRHQHDPRPRPAGGQSGNSTCMPGRLEKAKKSTKSKAEKIAAEQRDQPALAFAHLDGRVVFHRRDLGACHEATSIFRRPCPGRPFSFLAMLHVFDVLRRTRAKIGVQLDAAGGSRAARRRRVGHLHQHRMAGGLDFGIHTGFISRKHLGWLSGWLDVLPNAPCDLLRLDETARSRLHLASRRQSHLHSAVRRRVCH